MESPNFLLCYWVKYRWSILKDLTKGPQSNLITMWHHSAITKSKERLTISKALITPLIHVKLLKINPRSNPLTQLIKISKIHSLITKSPTLPLRLPSLHLHPALDLQLAHWLPHPRASPSITLHSNSGLHMLILILLCFIPYMAIKMKDNMSIHRLHRYYLSLGSYSLAGPIGYPRNSLSSSTGS